MCEVKILEVDETDVAPYNYTQDIFDKLGINAETDKCRIFVNDEGRPWYSLSHSGPEAVGLAIKLIEILKKREPRVIKIFDYYHMSSGHKWIVTPWCGPEGKSKHLSHALQDALLEPLGIQRKD
jgi:hypothetical protein